jgi:hypothetical protein
MKRLVIIGLCALLLAPVLLLMAIEWGIRSERRTVQRAVEVTVRNIRGLEARQAFSAEAANAAVVAPARLELFGTNTVRFRVDAHTSWPDWMIYEYDSRTPERGVYHYLF